MECFELVAITRGVADLPSVPFEVQVGVELALCGRGRQLRSTAMVVAHQQTCGSASSASSNTRSVNPMELSNSEFVAWPGFNMIASEGPGQGLT